MANRYYGSMGRGARKVVRAQKHLEAVNRANASAERCSLDDMVEWQGSDDL